MSFGDLYTVPPGGDVAPGLPPLELPSAGRPQRPRIEVVADRPKPKPPAAEGADPWAAFPDKPPTATRPGPAGPAQAAPAATAIAPAAPDATDPWSAFPDQPPEPAQPSRTVSTGEATLRGVAHGATFGAAPALAGVAEASGVTPQQQDEAGIDPMTGAPNLARPVLGALNLIHSAFSDHPDPEVKAAYERGRTAALEDERLAKEQHPYAFLGGMLGGAMVTPTFGALKAGTLLARAGGGAKAGAVGGAGFGAGTAISEGKDAGEVVKDAATGAVIGAPFGAVIGGVLGPRVKNALSPGARAAKTAEEIEAPLPRGLTSDSKLITGTTAKLRSVPFVGSKIAQQVEHTSEAAGNRVADIAGQMAGGATDRAAADVAIRPSLQGVTDRLKGLVDRAYDGVRSSINDNARFTMPRTDAVLNRIMAARKAAGWKNPAEGLEQFRTVAGGATFSGAHRARSDARAAGDVLNPHPGYNAGDFNQITRAMTADIRDIVRAAATTNPARAVQAFDKTEKAFGQVADLNARLSRLIDAKGEGAIATLLGAAKDKGGDLKLLAQLRNTMPQAEFEQIGGTLLNELGNNASTGQFSLAQFATNWNKISERSKAVLFSPGHLQHIEDIAGMGAHIKGALRESNTSHTASVLVLLDIAKDAALLGADVVSGGIGLGTAMGAGTSAAAVAFGRWLASPAKAASMSAWAKAYRSLTLGQPTPARLAVFNAATRNLSHNLGVPAARILQVVHTRATNPQPERNEEGGLNQ